tara:strand:+ start:190 stop:375 length:186 start_codon:yes stop_codon:yes gene_type:complete
MVCPDKYGVLSPVKDLVGGLKYYFSSRNISKKQYEDLAFLNNEVKSAFYLNLGLKFKWKMQ